MPGGNSDSTERGAERTYGQLAARTLALLLLLLIACLTLPKVAPRLAGEFRRGEARQEVWRKAAGKEKVPRDRTIRGADVLLFAAVAAVGGLLLLVLAYLALRRV